MLESKILAVSMILFGGYLIKVSLNIDTGETTNANKIRFFGGGVLLVIFGIWSLVDNRFE